MKDTILVAIISGVCSLLAVYFSNRKASALLEYRLQQLEKKVDIHNSVIERTFKLEEAAAVQEEKIKVANNRIADLEREVQSK